MDIVSKKKRSEMMSRVRSKNTGIELSLRKSLWERGLRYRIHYGPESIDIAFPSEQIAVFIDGCFWHGCPKHGTTPKTNRDYWQKKIADNVRRDLRKKRTLSNNGWKVLRIWQHELEDIDRVADKITLLVRSSKKS
jgi:DNA mismatch endonuclease (patch repair protein)